MKLGLGWSGVVSGISGGSMTGAVLIGIAWLFNLGGAFHVKTYQVEELTKQHAESAVHMGINQSEPQIQELITQHALESEHTTVNKTVRAELVAIHSDLTDIKSDIKDIKSDIKKLLARR